MQIVLNHIPKALKRHRMTKSGHTYDPSKADKKKVILELITGLCLADPISHPIGLSMIFTFPRPKKHYRTGKNSHLLSKSAPAEHTNTPDTDNLIKFYADCLVGADIISDDKIAVGMQGIKQWGDEGMVEIEVNKWT
tara:strand:+ start:1202 stop:1612 length:411 start_codon:yes stop_codon:yes gene_type:complete